MFVFRFDFEGPAKDYLIREEVKAARIARLIVFFSSIILALGIGIIWYYSYIALIISKGIVLLSFVFLIVVRQWDIVVPAEYNGLPVTEIKGGVWGEKRNSIKSVVLPDTVTKIERGLFASMLNLKRVQLGNAVTTIQVFGSDYKLCTTNAG